jgi:diguanylate cyclase (GGDEF)-like protein
VILPETDLAGATLLAERIRASVAALAPFANDTRAVTVSIGIGLYEANPQHDLASVLGAADEALYRAKANGRNRVEGPGD